MSQFSPRAAIISVHSKVRYLQAHKGRTSLNVLETFPSHTVHGWGKYRDRAALTIENINLLVPSLARLIPFPINDRSVLEMPCERSPKANQLSATLAIAFRHYGSDKSTVHNYHELYGALLADQAVKSVFEIGLGTNNTDVVSTMGKRGRPGASLRAFRDTFTEANIYGADIDNRVLFEEERIKTFWVDQMRFETLDQILLPADEEFDIMIDDGLHASVANLNSLAFFLPRLRVGGWAVIEDINPMTQPTWDIVTHLLSEHFESRLMNMQSASVFVVHRVS